MRRLLCCVTVLAVLGWSAQAPASDKTPPDKPVKDVKSPADKPVEDLEAPTEKPKDVKTPADKPKDTKKPTDKSKDTKPTDDTTAPAKSELPKMRFQHRTDRGNEGVFGVNGKTGTAEYVFDGVKHKDQLAYVRPATLDGNPGSVYQVMRDGKKADLWFLFGSQPVAERDGKKLYPMWYSQQPDDTNGKKPWIRIYTPTGTEGTALAANTPKK